MTVFIAAVLVCGAAYIIISPLRHHLHMLQQHSYCLGRYGDWYRSRWTKEYRRGEAWLTVPLMLAFFNEGAFVAAEIAVLVVLLRLYWPRPAREKKPLVLTKRATRLYALAALLTLADTLVLALLPYPLLVAGSLIVMCGLSWVYVVAATWLLRPLELKINNGFLKEAAAKIDALPDLIRIGITGSFGKTSTKLIMAAVLAEKYQTIATPGSFNTPMGVTRVIRDNLSPVDEVFVCEMGARQPGDIAELCRLVRPKIGVLTAIGEQHLETFGSIETITETKFELIESLPADGLAVLNGDDPRIIAHIRRSPCAVIRYGLDSANDYWADRICFGPAGSSFVFHHGETSGEFSTALLGRHMIVNLLAALAVADQLGVPLIRMQRAIKALQPIEHRLQLRPAGSYTIIDDAFNANPAGAAAAVEVLAAFNTGKKIIVTPGMVELGEKEYELNFNFGRQMAAVCDSVILVGKAQSRPLHDGLEAAAYPAERLYVATDLQEARSYLSRIVGPGDVVLFENDLPDTYNE